MTPATATLDLTPLDQVGAALAKRGFAIVQLSDAAALSLAFPPIRTALAAFHAAHRPASNVDADVDAQLVAFAERAQLRLQNPREVDADDDLHRSAARGGAVLQHVAEAALAQLRGLDAYHDASSAVCDVFYYPKSEQSPCPAHEDPGLVTVIADDAPGLEVRDAGGWRSVVLAEDEVAVLGNSGLAKIAGHPACVHRVVPCAERVSITFELRLNEAGVRAAAAAERARLLGDASAGSPPGWREKNRRAGCAVM